MKIKNRKKRKKRSKEYKNRFKSNHENFLLERLKEEWQEGERAAKKHELIKRAERGAIEFSKDLLKILVIGGVITVMAVAPNTFVAIGQLRRYRRFFKNVDASKEIRISSSKGYITYEKIDEITHRIKITEKGRKMLLKSAAERMKIKETKRWDGIWRIVIFDIPKKHNSIRELLRDRLKKMGMRQLQESVFVCPYPCEEEVWFWTSLYFASSFIRFIEARSISNSEDIKSFFDL